MIRSMTARDRVDVGLAELKIFKFCFSSIHSASRWPRELLVTSCHLGCLAFRSPINTKDCRLESLNFRHRNRASYWPSIQSLKNSCTQQRSETLQLNVTINLEIILTTELLEGFIKDTKKWSETRHYPEKIGKSYVSTHKQKHWQCSLNPCILILQN